MKIIQTRVPRESAVGPLLFLVYINICTAVLNN